MSNRSTFSIAQLLLLVMLTGLLCAWLRETVEWSRHRENRQRSGSQLSADGKCLLHISAPFGFAVFDTDSGRSLFKKSIQAEEHVGWDANLTLIYVFRSSSDSPFVSSHTIRIFDLASGTEKLVEIPPQEEMWHRYPPDLDPDGTFVDLSVLEEASEKPDPSPRLFRHWDLSTGEVIRQQIVDGESVDTFRSLSMRRLLLIGRTHLNPVEAEVGVPTGGFPDRLQPYKFSFVEWRLEDKTTRTLIPVTEWFFPRVLCLNRQEDKALLYKVRNKLAGRDTASLLMADAKTGTVRDLGASPFTYIAISEMTADEANLIGAGESQDGVMRVFRMDLSTLKIKNIAGLYEHTWENSVTDLKLVNNEQQIAIAFDSGNYRLLDATTGHDVQPTKNLRYRRSRTIWYALGTVNAVWAVLWWRSTKRKKEQGVDWGRYPVLFIPVLGFVIGLLLLFCRDQNQTVDRVMLITALVLACIGMGAGLSLLFARNCNRLAAAYTFLACAGMAAYVGYLVATYS